MTLHLKLTVGEAFYEAQAILPAVADAKLMFIVEAKTAEEGPAIESRVRAVFANSAVNALSPNGRAHTVWKESSRTFVDGGKSFSYTVCGDTPSLGSALRALGATDQDFAKALEERAKDGERLKEKLAFPSNFRPFNPNYGMTSPT